MDGAPGMDQADRGEEIDLAPGHGHQLRHRLRIPPGLPSGPPPRAATWSEPRIQASGLPASEGQGLGVGQARGHCRGRFARARGFVHVRAQRRRTAGAGGSGVRAGKAMSTPAAGGPATGFQEAPRSGGLSSAARGRARSAASCCSMCSRAASIESRTASNAAARRRSRAAAARAVGAASRAWRRGRGSGRYRRWPRSRRARSAAALRGRRRRPGPGSPHRWRRPLRRRTASARPAIITATDSNSSTVVKRAIRTGQGRSLPGALGAGQMNGRSVGPV